MSQEIKKISEARFRALTFSVDPIAFILFKEIEWYSDKNEYHIMSVIYDYTDQQWSYIIMARDEDYLFKCIDIGHLYKNIETARTAMITKLTKLASAAAQVHLQGEGKFQIRDIFELQTLPDKLNKNFILLKDDEGFTPAKEIVREIAYSFIDCDGRFFRDFQTAGFDARMWELYLYAYLHEENFILDRQYNSPDYLCLKGGSKISIEATTVNPPDFLSTNDEQTFLNSFEIKHEYNTIRFAKALNKKLKKKYWEKSHVNGLPLIFAIQSFECLGDSTSIIRYLYGVNHGWVKDVTGKLTIIPEKIKKHRHEQREIKSGFFFLSDSENISAVLFSNSGTISKFNRMGRIAGFGNNKIQMIRTGVYLNPDPNATMPIPFSYEVNSENTNEYWSEGLSMFHNPNAIHPIDTTLFPTISHHFYKEGQLVSCSNNSFKPLWSKTVVVLLH